MTAVTYIQGSQRREPSLRLGAWVSVLDRITKEQWWKLGQPSVLQTKPPDSDAPLCLQTVGLDQSDTFICQHTPALHAHTAQNKAGNPVRCCLGEASRERGWRAFLLGMDNCVYAPLGGVRALLTISVEHLPHARYCCHHWHWGLTGNQKPHHRVCEEICTIQSGNLWMCLLSA